jgi:hypothetical protein
MALIAPPGGLWKLQGQIPLLTISNRRRVRVGKQERFVSMALGPGNATHINRV